MMTSCVYRVFDTRQLLHSPAVELHNGGWVAHADQPSRAQKLAERLSPVSPAQDFGFEPLLRVHHPDYLAFLEHAHSRWAQAGRPGDAIGYAWPVVRRRPLDLSRIDAQLGRFSYDAATPIAAGTWQAAYWGAQTALTALQPLLQRQRKTSFALCRPPGHHAGADYLGGYCYLNNAAIAAQSARDAGCRRVAVLDVDYHHGNGTQDIFLEDPSVFFASLHGDPATEYPFFWGWSEERGVGPGEGTTLNLPLPKGSTIEPYMRALETALEAIEKFDPELLVVSYGADTWEADPISHFRIKTEDYHRMAQRISALDRPTLIVMEGGYAVDALSDNVASFLAGF